MLQCFVWLVQLLIVLLNMPSNCIHQFVQVAPKVPQNRHLCKFKWPSPLAVVVIMTGAKKEVRWFYYRATKSVLGEGASRGGWTGQQKIRLHHGRPKCDIPIHLSLSDFVQCTLCIVKLQWGQLTWLVILQSHRNLSGSASCSRTLTNTEYTLWFQSNGMLSQTTRTPSHTFFVSQVSILHCCHCVLDPMVMSLLSLSVSRVCSGILSLF